MYHDEGSHKCIGTIENVTATDHDAEQRSRLPLTRRTFLRGTLAAQVLVGTLSTLPGKAVADDGTGWPTFQFDSANTGQNPNVAGPQRDVQKRWQVTTDDAIRRPPSVVGDTAYVGSMDGRVYALNVDDGAERWRFATGGFIETAPTVVNGTVYVGSADGNLYAIDAGTGAEVWRFTTNGITGTPTVADETVFFGSNDTHVYAVTASEGTEEWRFSTDDFVRDAPAVANGSIFVGSGDDNVYALATDDGTERWRFETGDDVSAPSVRDGTVYIGSQDNKIYALDAADGTEVWQFTAEDIMGLAPAVANGTVFIGSRDGNVYAINASDGSERWRFDASFVLSPPAVANGVVYFGSYDNRVYALDASDGTELWRFETDDNVVASPSVTTGRAYIGSEDASIYALQGTVEADIDVKPDDELNILDPDDEDIVPVGIINGIYDPVEQVVVESLRFGASDVVDGGDGATPTGETSVEVIDGHDALVVEFPTDDTGFEQGDQVGKLAGQLDDGPPLFGTDSVTIGEKAIIDIKPDDGLNILDPDDEETIPVGIINGIYDPERTNVDTLRFGPPRVVDAGEGATPESSAFVERDGEEILVVEFPADDTGFEQGNEVGKLVGQTDDGTPLFGTDSVTIGEKAIVDIKPGHASNLLDPENEDTTPVGVVNGIFDPDRTDVESLRFGAPEVIDVGEGATPDEHRFVERDGEEILVVDFPADDTGFETGDEVGKIVGRTDDGTPLFGTDSVTVGQKAILDIKPATGWNLFDPDHEETIPVGIINGIYDPERTNVDTLRFGPPDLVGPEGEGGVEPTDSRIVERDGEEILVVEFPADDTGFEQGDEAGKLVGQTEDGTPLFGTDSVTIALNISMDIKPDDDDNTINLNNDDPTPVAIVNGIYNPVEETDVDSLRFGAPEFIDETRGEEGATPVHDGHAQDVNDDGSDELLVHFPTDETKFEEDDTEGKLVGKTTDGRRLFGLDSVTVVD